MYLIVDATLYGVATLRPHTSQVASIISHGITLRRTPILHTLH